jgi:hypothetical protein
VVAGTRPIGEMTILVAAATGEGQWSKKTMM